MSRNKKTDYVVFGLQRSGTNFCEKIISDNFQHMAAKPRDNAYIWKHKYNIDDEEFRDDVKHFLIYKNPYKWLDSIARKPVDIHRKYKEVFTSQNSETVMPNNIDGIHAIDLWIKWYLWWFKQVDVRNIQEIRYENLLTPTGPENFIQDTKKRWPDLIRVQEGNVKIPGKVGQSEPWSPQRSREYLNVELKHVNWRIVQAVNERIPSGFWKRMGYSMIDSEEAFRKHINN